MHAQNHEFGSPVSLDAAVLHNCSGTIGVSSPQRLHCRGQYVSSTEAVTGLCGTVESTGNSQRSNCTTAATLTPRRSNTSELADTSVIVPPFKNPWLTF